MKSRTGWIRPIERSRKLNLERIVFSYPYLFLVPEHLEGVSGCEMSKVVKRSIVIAGHKTSVSLEEPFWSALKEIARTRRATLSELVHSIDDTCNDRGASNLSSAIRLFVLDYYREEAQVESRVPRMQVDTTDASRRTDKDE